MTTLQQLRDLREKLLESGVVVARADGAVRHLSPVAVGPREGRALADWVRQERALSTLETGLGFAVATLFICEGLLANGPDGRHVAADPYQLERAADELTFAGVGLQILEEAGVRHLVEFHAVESQIALPRFLGEGRRFDLAFLDGNHRFEAVFLDLIYSGRLLKEGGIIFVDDTQLVGVRRAVEFCVRNLGWVVEDGGAEGALHEWMVLRTGPAEAFTRPFDAFVDF